MKMENAESNVDVTDLNPAESKSQNVTSKECRKTIFSVAVKKLRFENWKFHTIKSSFLFACLIGFLYQVYTFSEIYYSYPTRVDIEIIEPDEIIWPAITVCHLSPVRRTDYCKVHVNACVTPENLGSFCEHYRHYNCREGDEDFKVPVSRLMSDEEVMEFGHGSPFVNVSRPEHISGPFYYAYASEGILLACFSYNLHSDDSMDLAMVKFDESPFATPGGYKVFKLNLDRKEISIVDRPQVLFSLHSPFENVNPSMIGTMLYMIFYYTISVSMEEQQRLPPPYATACLDYEERWLKNKRTGPRSQQVCREKCSFNLSLQCHGCINRAIRIPQNQIPCPGDSKYDYCNDARLIREFNECYAGCKPACRELKYNYKMQQTMFLGLETDTEMHFFFPKREIVVMTHKKNFEGVELFSNVGGFMGCWLGFSVFSVMVLMVSQLQTILNNYFCFNKIHSIKQKELEL